MLGFGQYKKFTKMEHDKTNSEMMELTAIWLKTPVNGTRRIAAGDHICIDNGWLITADYATHKIIGCYGDIFSSFLHIMVIDIITNEPEILKLK
jgi:hypothetical protein